MPGSPVSAAKRGAPCSARSSASTSAPAGRRARPAARSGSARRRGRLAGVGRWQRGRRGAATAAPRDERGVLAEHRGLQVAQLGAGLETELAVEHVAHLAERVQGVGLAAGPGQRHRPQPPQPLAQRVRRGQRLELGGDGAVVAERERGARRGPRGPRCAAPPAGPAPPPRRARPRARRTGRPAPQRQRLVELREARREHVVGQPRWLPPGAAGAEPAVHAADGRSNRVGVEGVLGHPQRVAGGDGHQHRGRRARRAVGLERSRSPET